MPKNLFQDMVRIKRMQNNKKALFEKPSPEKKADQTFLNDHPPKILEVKNNQNDRHGRNHKLWLVAGISAIFLFFALSYNFSKVSIVVHPKVKEITLKESLVASSNNSDKSLSFKSVSLSGEEEKTVPATSTEDVLKSAEGTVVLYNNYNSSPQVFSIDTRLTGSNGKIYKTKSKITVPGKNKNGKPGSVQVGIYAASPGPEYNSSPLDFQILGFKGTPKYQKFYGRSLGAITGGLKGKIGVITDKEKEGMVKILNESLKAKLLEKATAQIPPGFILFKDASFLNTEIENIDTTKVKENIFTIKIKGTFHGFLFKEDELTKKIIEGNLSDYDNNPVFIPDIKNLTFSLNQNNLSNTEFVDPENVSFNLEGKVRVAWKVEVEKLKTDLLGIKKSNFTNVLLQYPSIASADLTISPMWRMSIPDKSKNINIIVDYPK